MMPSLASARPDAPARTPHPDDFTFISLETTPEINSEIAFESPVPPESPAALPEVSVEKSGVIPAKEGTRLRVDADPGNVHIFTDESAQVSYRVRVDADAHAPGAEEFVRQFTITARQTPHGILLDGNLPWREFRGPFSVSYEIHVPRRFNITVHTLGGNIDVQDIEGRMNLFTEGGNITAGRVDAGSTPSPALTTPSQGQAGRIAAKLTTMGGRITIGDVAGTLRASTSGGHITAGNIGGDAILHTGGGQIRTGRISGVGTVDTGGGNIMAWLSNGPAQETAVSKNAIPGVVPEKDSGDVRTAHAASQFMSSEGDVVVYLPREMAATIDAVIEQGARHRIFADPSLPQKISCQDSGPGLGTDSTAIRCSGDVNGGGEVLLLRAVHGNIVLKVANPQQELSPASSANWMESAARPPAFEAPDAHDGTQRDARGDPRRNVRSASDNTEDYNDAIRILR